MKAAILLLLMLSLSACAYSIKADKGGNISAKTELTYEF